MKILSIIKTKLLQNNNNQITHQILSLIRAVLSQNYFSFQQKIYQPEQGISMGSPISSLIAEIFLQHYEDANIKQLLDSKNVAFYTRYVDDILVIFDTTKINPHAINTYTNNIQNNIKLNPTYEDDSFIDFIDLTILRRHTKLEIDIYIENQPPSIQKLTFFSSSHGRENGSLYVPHNYNAYYATGPRRKAKRMGNNKTDS